MSKKAAKKAKSKKAKAKKRTIAWDTDSVSEERPTQKRQR